MRRRLLFQFVRCRLAALCVGVVLALGLSLPVHAVQIVLALSSAGEAQQAFADALQGELTRHGLRLTLAGNLEDGLNDDVLARADLVIAAGAPAAARVAERHRRPTLAVLLSRRQWAGLRASQPQAPLSAFLLDQPAERQVRLIGAVLPKGSRVGVLRSAESGELDPELGRTATAGGLKLIEQTVADAREVIGGLERLLPMSDALLVLPDPVLSASNPARSMLLTSYRFRRPIFAFSKSYVDAGALAAVYSTPEDVATDTADWLRSLNGGVVRLPSPRGPSSYRVAVNRQVARSLNIGVPSDEQLLGQLAAGGPR